MNALIIISIVIVVVLVLVFLAFKLGKSKTETSNAEKTTKEFKEVNEKYKKTLATPVYDDPFVRMSHRSKK